MILLSGSTCKILSVVRYSPVPAGMTVNVPWSTLRPNPRDQRERAAINTELVGEGGFHSTKDAEPEIVWDIGDFGKRMAFGGIVSSYTSIVL